jgi:hypothetical protein
VKSFWNKNKDFSPYEQALSLETQEKYMMMTFALSQNVAM